MFSWPVATPLRAAPISPTEVKLQCGKRKKEAGKKSARMPRYFHSFSPPSFIQISISYGYIYLLRVGQRLRRSECVVL